MAGNKPYNGNNSDMMGDLQLWLWLRNLWSLDHQELAQDALQLRRWHCHDRSVVCLNTQLEVCNPNLNHIRAVNSNLDLILIETL